MAQYARLDFYKEDIFIVTMALTDFSNALVEIKTSGYYDNSYCIELYVPIKEYHTHVNDYVQYLNSVYPFENISITKNIEKASHKNKDVVLSLYQLERETEELLDKSHSWNPESELFI